MTGGGTVIESVTDGEKGAVSIDRFLRGEPLEKERFIVKGQRKEVPYIDPSEEIKKTPRPDQAKLSMEKRLQAFAEVEMGYSKSQAIFEAGRCLRCDRKESEEKI